MSDTCSFGCKTSLQAWNVTRLNSVITVRLHMFNEARTIIHDICSKEEITLVGRFVFMLWVL